jgi:hypothetical protein
MVVRLKILVKLSLILQTKVEFQLVSVEELLEERQTISNKSGAQKKDPRGTSCNRGGEALAHFFFQNQNSAFLTTADEGLYYKTQKMH